MATNRRVRRRQVREAKTRRQREVRRSATRSRLPFFSRISSDWIVAGIIGGVVLIAVLVFLFANVFRSGGGSGDAADINQVFSFAVDPTDSDMMFLGDATGLFKSDDGGRRWDRDDLLVDPIRSVFRDPSAGGVWWATGGSVIWRSTDNGETWSRVTTDLPQTANLSALATDPLDPSQMYTVHNFGEEKGLYRSIDGGATWTEQIALEGVNVTMLSLAVKPGNPDVLYGFHTVDGFVKSTNGGRTLVQTGEGLPTTRVTDILAYADEPDTLYAAAGGLVYKSEDSGETWVAKAEGLDGVEPRALSLDPNTGDLYVADFIGRVYVSADGGDNWSLNAGS